jgi:sigma-E factor negative regulatory protein RseA
MSENRKEQLSAMIDGEVLPDEELMGLLKDSDEWRARWQRYHLARLAFRGELPNTLAAEVPARVRAALENEPVVLAPRRARRLRGGGGLAKQAAGMAIAATIATVAVLSVQNSTRIENEPAPQQVAAVPPVETVPRQVASVPTPPSGLQRVVEGATAVAVTGNNVRQPPAGLSAGVQTKLSGYLVNHNEFSSRTGMQGIPAYTRIVSITPGVPVANDQ